MSEASFLERITEIDAPSFDCHLKPWLEKTMADLHYHGHVKIAKKKSFFLAQRLHSSVPSELQKKNTSKQI